MLVIGGYYANTSFTQCDSPKYMGQHGLLLGQETKEVAPPDTKWWWRLWHEFNGYRVPDTIVSLVGGKYVNQLHGWKIDNANRSAVPQVTRLERHPRKAGQHLRHSDRTSRT